MIVSFHARAKRFAATRRALGGALAALTVLVVAACGDESADGSAADFVARAEQYLATHDQQAAVIEAKNALQADPDSIDARLVLGQAFLELGNPRLAETELSRARGMGAEFERFAIPLARAYLGLGETQTLLDELNVDPSLDAAVQGDLLALRAFALAVREEYGDARGVFEQALDINPDAVWGHVGVAGLALRDGDVDAAEEAMAKAVALAPEDDLVLTVQGDVAFARKNYADAEVAYQTRADLAPLNPFPRLPLSYAQVLAGKPDEAIENIEFALRALPKNTMALYLRALAAAANEDQETAEKYSKQALGQDPDHLPSQRVAGSASFAVGQLEQAAAYLAGYVSDAPDDEAARKLQATALLRLNRGEEAMEALAPLLEKGNRDATVLSLIGQAAVQRGDLETGQRYFEELAALAPDDPETIARLGVIEFERGGQETGIAKLEQALALDPNLDQVAFRLFEAHLRAGKYPDALAVAGRFQESYPEKASGYAMEGVAHAEAGDIEAARSALRKALEQQPGHTYASVILADLEREQDNPGASRAVLRSALELDDKNPVLLTRLADLESQTGNAQEAGALLQRAMAAVPDDPIPVIALARLLVQRGNRDAGIEMLTTFVNNHQDDTSAIGALGIMQLEAGRFEASLSTLQRLDSAQQDTPIVQYMIASAFGGVGDRVRQERHLTRAIELNPDLLLPKIALAGLHAAENNNEKFDKVLGELVSQAPEDARVLQLQASKALSNKDYDRVHELLDRAEAAFGGDIQSVALMRATAFFRSREPDQGMKVFDDWLDAYPEDDGMRMRRAAAALELGRRDLAKSDYAHVAAKSIDRWTAANDLAWLLREDGNLDEAEVHVERALKGSFRAPGVLDTAGVIYLEKGDTARAVAAFREAADKDPENASIGYNLARALARAGDTPGAVTTLKAILENPAPFPERLDAEGLLQSLGG